MIFAERIESCLLKSGTAEDAVLGIVKLQAFFAWFGWFKESKMEMSGPFVPVWLNVYMAKQFVKQRIWDTVRTTCRDHSAEMCATRGGLLRCGKGTDRDQFYKFRTETRGNIKLRETATFQVSYFTWSCSIKEDGVLTLIKLKRNNRSQNWIARNGCRDGLAGWLDERKREQGEKDDRFWVERPRGWHSRRNGEDLPLLAGERKTGQASPLRALRFIWNLEAREV